jgi:hypothetical protein
MDLPRLSAHSPAFAAFCLASTLVCAVPATAEPQVCPPQGSAKQALAKELNLYKNRQGGPLPAEVDPAATLPSVLAAGPDLGRWNHDKAAVFEGVVVNVKVGGIETANCKATDPEHRDTHIEIALDPGAAETQRVVVEVTPYWRNQMRALGLDWSTQALKSSLINERVRVTGWLFDDLEHFGEAENTHPHGPQNWRASVWEIHPITAIEILPAMSLPPNPSFTSAAALYAHPLIIEPKGGKKCSCKARSTTRKRR